MPISPPVINAFITSPSKDNVVKDAIKHSKIAIFIPIFFILIRSSLFAIIEAGQGLTPLSRFGLAYASTSYGVGVCGASFLFSSACSG